MVNPGAVIDSSRDLTIVARSLPASRDRALAVARIDWLRAEALIRINRPHDAAKYVDHGLAIVRRVAPISKLHGELANAKGSLAVSLGDVQTALSSYQDAYRILGGAREPRGQAIALQDIGSIYRSAGDFESALRYNADSAEVYSGDPAVLLAAYNNRGNALYELERFAAAETEYQRALEQARKLNSPMMETRILRNLATSQALAGDLDSADATLARAFALARNGPAASWLPVLYGAAAKIAFLRHQFDKAAVLIERSFAGLDVADPATPLRDFHFTAYQIFKARGDARRALVHLEAYKKIDDEARALTASTSAALMSARFDFANQNTRIARARADEANAKARLRTTVLFGLLAAAGVISILLLIGFLSIRRSRNQVRAANDSLIGTNRALEKALAAKTEFLATTSHEIRTPLNGILGMTQVILADGAMAPPLRGRIELIHGASETMRALVDDLLDVAKMETGEIRLHREEMDLIRLLTDAGEVWAAQAQTKGVRLETDIADAPARIIEDGVRLRQIVFNLMSNALKFTDSGHVRLTASVADGSAGERLILAIADTGIGIPPDRIEEIFESFSQVDGGTTRRHGGTGLGLTICRNLARAMGGDVRASSSFGAGSLFTVDLPLTRAAAAPQPVRMAARATALSAASVLLLEANPLHQSILRALLQSHVRVLRVTGDADEALAAVRAGGVDHVVADGGALGHDPGRVAALAAAAAAGSTRMTLLWSAPDEAAAAALAEAGARHIVAKPVSGPDLVKALQRVYGIAITPQEIAA